jgi:N-acetylmuramic acid 6-phosphate etherase
MVGVQASNRKLVDRSIGMIAEITGVDRAEAESLLDAAGGDVRVAILLAMTEMTPDEAKASLEGWVSLREILEGRGAKK